MTLDELAAAEAELHDGECCDPDDLDAVAGA